LGLLLRVLAAWIAMEGDQRHRREGGMIRIGPGAIRLLLRLQVSEPFVDGHLDLVAQRFARMVTGWRRIRGEEGGTRKGKGGELGEQPFHSPGPLAQAVPTPFHENVRANSPPSTARTNRIHPSSQRSTDKNY